VTVRPRVLVTDAEERAALAACRGLSAAGYHVSTAASGRLAVGHWSRASRERFTLPDPRDDPAAYAEQLGELLRRSPQDVLLPGSEASLIAVSSHRALIEPWVAVGLPSHEFVLRALDKLLLQREAASAGLAAPASVVCSSTGEALRAAHALGFPVVVKPARSFALAGGGLRKGVARVATAEAKLGQAVAALRMPVTVQQYTPGAKIVSCAGVRTERQLLGLTLARYARTWPPEVGSASMARTVQLPEGLPSAVETLLARIGWVGIFELELLDLGDGRLAAIDLNPRVFGWLALAVAAGANLPALWCDHLLGRIQPEASAALPGVLYRWEDGELRHVLRELGHRRVRAAVSLLRPRRRVTHPYFVAGDPGPLFARALSFAAKLGS
jgi:predicted ATP-grasp superfamily ATP-dependent carboligase